MVVAEMENVPLVFPTYWTLMAAVVPVESPKAVLPKLYSDSMMVSAL